MSHYLRLRIFWLDGSCDWLPNQCESSRTRNSFWNLHSIRCWPSTVFGESTRLQLVSGMGIIQDRCDFSHFVQSWPPWILDYLRVQKLILQNIAISFGFDSNEDSSQEISSEYLLVPGFTLSAVGYLVESNKYGNSKDLLLHRIEVSLLARWQIGNAWHRSTCVSRNSRASP